MPSVIYSKKIISLLILLSTIFYHSFMVWLINSTPIICSYYSSRSVHLTFLKNNRIRTLYLHSSGILSLFSVLLYSFVGNSSALSSRHFQAFTGIWPGPTAFPLFTIFMFSPTSSMQITPNVSIHSLPVIHTSLSHFLQSSVSQSIPSIFSICSPRQSFLFHRYLSSF